MNTYTFSTNFKCQGCVTRVGEKFDENTEIASWDVNLESPEKILTVETELSSEDIQKIVSDLGYTINEK